MLNELFYGFYFAIPSAVFCVSQMSKKKCDYEYFFYLCHLFSSRHPLFWIFIHRGSARSLERKSDEWPNGTNELKCESFPLISQIQWWMSWFRMARCNCECSSQMDGQVRKSFNWLRLRDKLWMLWLSICIQEHTIYWSFQVPNVNKLLGVAALCAVFWRFILILEVLFRPR